MKKTQIAEAIEIFEAEYKKQTDDTVAGSLHWCLNILYSLLPAEREDIKMAYASGVDAANDEDTSFGFTPDPSEYFDKTFKQ